MSSSPTSPSRVLSHEAGPDLIFVDTETSGFSPRQGAVALEVAAARVCAHRGIVTHRFSSLVAPPYALDRGEGHWGVHGLRPAEVAAAPAPSVVWDQMRTALDLEPGLRWIAHPARFDRPFWEDWTARADIDLPRWAPLWGCSLSWLKRARSRVGIHPQWRSARTGQMGPSDKLEAWGAALSLKPQGQLHRAATDVDLLVRIVQTVRRQLPPGAWP